MNVTYFYLISLCIFGLMVAEAAWCPDGEYLDTVTDFCERCSDICSPGRDSAVDCPILCPGFGKPKVQPTIPSPTTITTSIQTTSAVTPVNQDEAAASSAENEAATSEVSGRDKLGPMATKEALVSQATEGDVSVTTTPHTNNQVVVVIVAMIALLAVVCVVLLLGFLLRRRRDSKKCTENDKKSAVQIPVEVVEFRFSEAGSHDFKIPIGTVINDLNPDVQIDPSLTNNSNYESSSPETSHSDPGYESGPVYHPYIRGLQSNGTLPPSATLNPVFYPEPVHHGRTAGGAIVGNPHDDDSDRSTTSLKQTWE